MGFSKNTTFIYLLLSIFFLFGCKKDTQWAGQAPLKKVNTQSLPIQLQYKGVFDLGDGVFMSNDYIGARLNGVTRSNNKLITVLISAENAPINNSPWYGFKVWSETEKDISVRLTYDDNGHQRYPPKISNDGLIWNMLDSMKYETGMETVDNEEVPKNLTMELSVSKDTLWISAQELITSTTVDAWTSELLTDSYVAKLKIGESNEGRPVNLLKIGDSNDQKMLIVISRQHPPEVTGFLAFKSFIETISSDSDLAHRFRKEYNTYVVPLVNPDGVDNGHWRHSYGGVDLNRDWEDFNQPETSAIRDFMMQKVKQSGGKFYFGADFHSTYHDIFYTISPTLKGNMPGLVPDLIEAIGAEFADYIPNIKPSPGTGLRVNSTSFFFHEYGAESVTYEVGDNTPRAFVKQKGEVTAVKLMELMLK